MLNEAQMQVEVNRPWKSEGSWWTSPFRNSAAIGATIGSLSGLAVRVIHKIDPTFSSSIECKADFGNKVLDISNNVMQSVVKNIAVAMPLVFQVGPLFTTPIVCGLWSWNRDVSKAKTQLQKRDFQNKFEDSLTKLPFQLPDRHPVLQANRRKTKNENNLIRLRDKEIKDIKNGKIADLRNKFINLITSGSGHQAGLVYAGFNEEEKRLVDRCAFLKDVVNVQLAGKNTLIERINYASGKESTKQFSLPWRKVALAVSIPLVAFGTALVQGSYKKIFADLTSGAMNLAATQLPEGLYQSLSYAGWMPIWIQSADPSGHIMMQISCAVAGAIAINAASTSRMAKTAFATTIVSLGIAVGNAVSLAKTSYICHTFVEVLDGFKWAGWVITATWATTRLVEKFAGRKIENMGKSFGSWIKANFDRSGVVHQPVNLAKLQKPAAVAV